MNVKVKMAGGRGGGMSQALARDMSPPPHIPGQLHWQIALCLGWRRERRTIDRIKNLDIKNTLLLLPPSLSIGANLVQNSKFN